MTDPIKVAVIYGGRSNEHSVSCVSAGSVMRHLDADRFDVIPIGITRAGTWVEGTADPTELQIRDRVLPSVAGAGVPLALGVDPENPGRITRSVDGTAEDIGAVDVVFPVLHGAYGEDGTVQGLFEVAGVPYVGPGVLASAAAMDKEFTKKLLAAEGLPVGRQVVLRRDRETLTSDERDVIGLPAFVKPARGGSSIGITRIVDWAELDDAVAVAREHDPKVVIEAAIVGREVECGVLEMPDGSVRASVVAEIRMDEASASAGGATFYDFDSKYLDDVVEFDIPALLDDDVSTVLREIAVRAFAALDLQGLARVDFFVTDDGPVINEINTMPGFTAISMYPRMWEATGVGYSQLVGTLVDTALARGTGLR
ncbi:D-alanine--D-alanine ligase [Rhodococcus sp. BP-316]|uniref:D-alanine--D-alanine ligase family protein n=1 Tax=Rhodococcus sp. BP-316 TaxID=2739445 RepID=UPI001C9B9E09|nr:D-alanine--D-alanine ligase family protein [Rhodococcus sp. BP-316]MBY6680005.1 D-alanine--D-alanine ligase [Rhodococcus sp. BP-316]